MLQIAGNCALRQKHKDKKIRTQLAKTRTKESTAFRFGSSQVLIKLAFPLVYIPPKSLVSGEQSNLYELLRGRVSTTKVS